VRKEGVMDAAQWAAILVRKSLERGSDDNISAIVIALNDARLDMLPQGSAKVQRRRDKIRGGVAESDSSGAAAEAKKSDASGDVSGDD